ncbi:four-carbon acid sugar kinase family protein [Acetonema longum]|uniref:Type III effector Hrp-dependent outer domain protein n=1 Tax=Acetonema longum DSM 6540 TaxID=1009370 RepID=F7NGK9_9FIRM|nr:four-carbon acid sugar kinase family protein [Acetonema longum]EGO64813.1 type III effector Hrp-dependent outer domain protein [Acetonema longum DSM 6540]
MIGVVADDTTGANDIGIMFSNNQYSVKVVTFQEDMKLSSDVNVLIIDTDSRLDKPEVSYDKVFRATQYLKKLRCSLYYKKTCSVFRGNIGREFDAMMDALGENFAVISLAFPKNGRKTVNGIHTVYGNLLEKSEFAKDPVHPTAESNLETILQRQTKRKVSLIKLDVVRQGTKKLYEEIETARKKSNYCIIDSENQADLTVVAEAAHKYPMLCGSSAIAEELPKFLDEKKLPGILERVRITDDKGVLVIAGSLTPQTKAQTAYLISGGMPVAVLDSRKVFVKESYVQEIARITREAGAILEQGQDVLIMANNQEKVVAETKKIGEELKMDPLSVSKLVSAALAEIAGQLVTKTGLKRLVVAGGDTSGTVCRRLGIKGNYVLREIETGLPSGLAMGRELLIVLKSGSFGKEHFLLQAVEHLKELSNLNKGAEY